MVRSIREQASFEAVAALCVGLVLCAVAPPAQAAPPRAKAALLVVPFVALSGASEPFAVLVSDETAAELRARDGVKLAEAPASGNDAGEAAKARLEVEAAQGQVRDGLARASALARKDQHAEAAKVLERAVALLSARPLALDAAGGKLFAEATLRLAVARARAGDDEGGEAALDALVRIDPERRLSAAEFPPAFLRAHESLRRSVLGGQRGAIRVHAPEGVADAQVLLDGRALHAAPVLLAGVLPGAHAVRVERGGQAWAERVICIPDTEVSLTPQLGGAGAGPAAALRAALGAGELSRASVLLAAKLARAAFAQAALVGAVAREGTGFAVRAYLVLARSEKAVALAPVQVDGERARGAGLARLAGEAASRLASPGAEAALPAPLGIAARGASEGAMDTVAAAPDSAAVASPAPPAPDAPLADALAAETPRVVALPGSPLPPAPAPAPAPAAAAPAAAAPAAPAPAEEPGRRVAIPGSAAAPRPPAPPAPAVAPPIDDGLVAARQPAPSAAAEPSRNLVIPREASRDDEAVAADRPRAAPPAAVQLQAVEANELKTVREPPAAGGSHTLLWIIAGVVVAGGLAAGGLLLYENGRTPTTATISAGWTH